MRNPIIVLLLLAGCATRPEPRPVTAERAAELAPVIAGMQQYLRANPDHEPLIYLIASRHAEAGNAEEAIRHLRDLQRRDWSLGVNRPDFRQLFGNGEIETLLDALEVAERRVSTSRRAFELNEIDLVPEGITYDPETRSFLLGSIRKRKVIRVDERGEAHDLILPGTDGLAAVLGMKVDPQRRLLWLASSGEKLAKDLPPSEEGKSALYAFQLATGRAAKRLSPPGEERHQLNDLCIAPNGDLFVTDSAARAIYVLRKDKENLEPLLQGGQFSFPNGIACDPEQPRLYVGTFGGIVIVDANSGMFKRLEYDGDDPIGGIDGLYLHRGTLIGIQNTFGRGRIIRVRLDESGERATSVETLEAGHRGFHLPTTGTIVGDTFYYIANSQLRMYEDDGTRAIGVETRRPLVMRLPLR